MKHPLTFPKVDRSLSSWVLTNTLLLLLLFLIPHPLTRIQCLHMKEYKRYTSVHFGMDALEMDLRQQHKC